MYADVVEELRHRERPREGTKVSLLAALSFLPATKEENLFMQVSSISPKVFRKETCACARVGVYD
jgi:hypothetical protein